MATKTPIRPEPMPLPGMNRAQRRQMLRTLGWRGTKANRQFPDRKAHVGKTKEELTAEREKAIEAQAKHVRLNEARKTGLIIPPTAEELESLKAGGKIDHDPRIALPGE